MFLFHLLLLITKNAILTTRDALLPLVALHSGTVHSREHLTVTVDVKVKLNSTVCFESLVQT